MPDTFSHCPRSYAPGLDHERAPKPKAHRSTAPLPSPHRHTCSPTLTIVLAVSLLAVLLTVVPAARASPRAVQGQLDLTSWDLTTIRLEGEWEFYWDQLLEPSDFAGTELPTPTEFAAVPDAWNEHVSLAQRMPGDGFATYRLRIRLPKGLPDPLPNLALYIPYEQTAYRLWINGNLAATNGVVGTDRASSTPEYRTIVTRFHPRGEQLEVVIQISNFAHRVGGLWTRPILGTQERIDRLLMARVFTKGILIGTFIFVALYHCVWFLLRPMAKASLYLALLSLAIALRTILMGDQFLSSVVTWVPWEWQIRIEYLAGYLAIIGCTMVLRTTFPAESSKTVTRVIVISQLAGALMTLIVPVRYSSLSIPSLIIVDAACIVYFVVVLLLALKNRRRGSSLLLTGGAILALTALADLLYYNRILGVTNLMPIGFLCLIVMQAFVLGREFAQSFQRQVTLTADLERSHKLIAELHERERREVAEFLHSRVQTRLALVWHKATQALSSLRLGDGQTQGLLERVRAELDDIRENDIRRASHLLHPSVIEIGLLPSIRTLAAEYQGIFDVAVHADDEFAALDRATALDPDNGNTTLPDSTRLCIYLIVEECLINIHKHAAAKQVSITLGLSLDGNLQLRVIDDGKGYDDTATQRGLGLKVIDARVSHEGGTWNVTSRPNAGTMVEVRIPLTRRQLQGA